MTSAGRAFIFSASSFTVRASPRRRCFSGGALTIAGASMAAASLEVRPRMTAARESPLALASQAAGTAISGVVAIGDVLRVIWQGFPLFFLNHW